MSDRAGKTPRGRDADSRLVLGIIILLIGVGLLAERVFHGLAEGGVVLLVGIVFLVLWLLRGRYAQLVLGCLLTAAGAGGLIAHSLDTGHAGSISLGCGFIAIYLLDLVRTRSAHWWPLLPGAVLVAGGVLAETSVLRQYFWPAALVIVGVAILGGEWRRRGPGGGHPGSWRGRGGSGGGSGSGPAGSRPGGPETPEVVEGTVVAEDEAPVGAGGDQK